MGYITMSTMAVDAVVAVDVAAIRDFAFAYTHSPIDFYFRQGPRDFVVSEIPLYDFSGDGVHLILKIRKKNLTTFEVLKIFSNYFGIKEQDIGYAGLKDKNALSVQYFSFPAHLVKDKLESFSYDNIKILEITKHNNKIKLGHLKGNNFFIRLKKLTPLNAQKISNVLESVAKFGIPNYFSYQRFGNYGDNYLEGKAIVDGSKKIRNKKIEKFLISAYQSFLFNSWLSLRLEISHIINTTASNELYRALGFHLKDSFKEVPQEFKEIDFCKNLKKQTHFFKILYGDILCHYPYGKNFSLAKSDDLLKESGRFLSQNISITGLLCGIKADVSDEIAGYFEKNFLDSNIKSVGQRRYAWVYPSDISFNYKEIEAQGELSFFLPKGAYATNLLRELAHREIMEPLES
ncbi:MAG: tRNA pseudouridine(13) synthase TruD [Helicobacter sp.]|nr:tRNA pseudouridine(13) synthase TruD [Helicobacter sp.]